MVIGGIIGMLLAWNRNLFSLRVRNTYTRHTMNDYAHLLNLLRWKNLFSFILLIFDRSIVVITRDSVGDGVKVLLLYLYIDIFSCFVVLL